VSSVVLSRSWRRGSFLRRRRRAAMLLTVPALVFVGVFFFAPVVEMGWMSLKSWPLLGHATFRGLGNYRELLHDTNFHHALVVSVVFVAAATPATVLLGLGLALLVNRPRPGVAIFRSIYFLPLVVGFAPAAYIWLWMLNPDVGPVDRLLDDLHLTSSPVQWLANSGTAQFAAATLFVWKTVGFSMLLLMGGMQGIPTEIREAAAVDGAGKLRTLMSVTLPMMRRTIALVFVFSTVGSFLVFEPFFILTRGGPGHATTGIVQWVFSTSFFDYRLGYGAAGSLVLMVVLVAFTAVQLRAMKAEDPS
jgi:multiple sugar transport system permease protein